MTSFVVARNAKFVLIHLAEVYFLYFLQLFTWNVSTWSRRLSTQTSSCVMAGVRRVESRWTGWSAEADENSGRWADTQQGWTDAGAQQTDARKLRPPASDTRPWSQPWFILQEQVASSTEAGVHAGQTRRRNQSKKLLLRYWGSLRRFDTVPLQRVTDRWTDRRTDNSIVANTGLCIASYADAL